MRKKLDIALLLIALCLCINTNANVSQKVKVGVHYNPPLCSIDSSHQAKGIFIDLINQVAEVNNWEIEYIPVGLADGIDALKYGKIDLLSTVARTKEREQFIHFCEETIFTNWGVIYGSSKSSIESITDLNNKNIALEKQDIHGQALLKLLNDFNIEANIIWCNGLPQIFNKLRNNEADAGAVNKLYGYQQNLNQKLKVTPILFNPVNVSIAGGPLSKSLLNDVDKALIYLKTKQPELYQNTINQWLIKDAKQTPEWLIRLIYILSGFIILLLASLFIQRSIVRKKNSRLKEATKLGHLQDKTIKQIEYEKTLILNSLDEQVVFMDKDYNLVWANDAFKKASSTPFDQLVGQKCYKAYFNRETPCDFCNFDTCLITNRTEVREHISEHSGKIFTHKTHPVFDDEHRPIGFVEILSDISDKKKDEEELIAAKEKAEQSDYLKSAFLANMSHEIRTPMNAIIGFSELLEDDTLTKHEKNSYLNIIQSNGNQLLKLISDILIFSQIEAGHVNLQYSYINIDELLQSTYKQFKSEISKVGKSIDIYLNTTIDQLGELETDIVRFKQIIYNLLTNAIKFTEEGSITLGASIEDNQLKVYVRDTGIGIPKSKYKDVFERFSQVENNQLRKASGSGLGLTIAKDLIQQLGGEINLDSEVGKGSTFYLTHPLSRYKLAKGASVVESKILNAKK